MSVATTQRPNQVDVSKTDRAEYQEALGNRMRNINDINGV